MLEGAVDINRYLTKLSEKLVVDPDRKVKMDFSIANLKTKVWGHFQERIQEVTIFGSYDRGTFIISDPDADIDVLVVFKKNEFKPETYLRQVREFGEQLYPRSDVYPDFPTISIESDLIKFELVPAYGNSDTFKIPAPKTKQVKWIETNPSDFKKRLIQKDNANKGNILPIVRIYKL